MEIIRERMPDLVSQVESGLMTVDQAEGKIAAEAAAIEAQKVSARLVVKNISADLTDFIRPSARSYIVSHVKSLGVNEMDHLFSLVEAFSEIIESITEGE